MSQWLLDLERDLGAYRRLLESQGIVLAAYAVARERVRTRSLSRPVPMPHELRSAALEIVERAGSTEHVPSAQTLAVTAEAYGLPVMSRHSNLPAGNSPHSATIHSRWAGLSGAAHGERGGLPARKVKSRNAARNLRR